MKNKILCFFMGIVFVIPMLTGCSSTVDEPCDYCGKSPSIEYMKSDDTPFYICKECSSTCMICGDEKATTHYESLLGIIFACDDCYQKVKQN